MRIVRNAQLKHVAGMIAALALVAWAWAGVLQTKQNSDLIAKNEDLITLVEDLERQNTELDNLLQCRAEHRDRMDIALGRGLAAVARDDPTELARQADIVIEVADALEHEC